MNRDFAIERAEFRLSDILLQLMTIETINNAAYSIQEKVKLLQNQRLIHL